MDAIFIALDREMNAGILHLKLQCCTGVFSLPRSGVSLWPR